ncbi:MAG TPA: metalloregulator ArsR/SmtB family transcription factor [Ilumatobacteraceae bacterium]|nr:metalloregulator ArsR/SmtB family transcription factor [Ilumatobacteraceae bacterium]
MFDRVVDRPALPLETLLQVLWALDEETRLRIVALLQHGELTVTDLTDILGQSQPRISRHLKLLADAGVVDKHREGTWAFFDLVTDGPVGELVGQVLAMTDPHDGRVAADLDRLGVVRSRRAAAAQEYFAGIAPRWDEERSLHASDAIVEQAIIETLGSTSYSSMLDVGTGTGRMLQLLGGRAERAVGLDSSHSMLAVARANLERAEVRGIDLRQGDIYSPPFAGDSFDLIVIHQVLHFLDEPAQAVRAVARLLTQGGRLLIVDFSPHSLEFLRTEHAHLRLGFRADTVAGWLEQAGLDVPTIRTIESPDVDSSGGSDRLTVSLWLGRDRRHSLFAAETNRIERP